MHEVTVGEFLLLVNRWLVVGVGQNAHTSMRLAQALPNM